MLGVTCLFLADASITGSSPGSVQWPSRPSRTRPLMTFQHIGALEPRTAGQALMGALHGMGRTMALQVFASFVTFQADGTLVGRLGCRYGTHTATVPTRLHDIWPGDHMTSGEVRQEEWQLCASISGK